MSTKEHTITIDGQAITVPTDTYLIEACRKLGINVPTLCYNENLHPYGVCRICMVEVNDGRRTRLVPSCVYEIRKDGLTVTTDSERIRRNRKWIIQLLLSRCENEKIILDLAAKYGVELNTRLIQKLDDCILCGLCVRTCADIVGVAAISFEGRGYKREVTTPWRIQNDACIACGSCAYVCPTSCIKMNEENGIRTISRWDGEKAMVVREAKMISCEKCGNYYLPAAVPEAFSSKLNMDKDTLKVCNDCR